jgi:hypothetical protein
MESNQLTRKLVRWTLILQEYDFDIVDMASRVNWDTNGLNQNPSSSEGDTIGAKCHGKMDLEAVP